MRTSLNEDSYFLQRGEVGDEEESAWLTRCYDIARKEQVSRLPTPIFPSDHSSITLASNHYQCPHAQVIVLHIDYSTH
jgi:hypothetical protein